MLKVKFCIGSLTHIKRELQPYISIGRKKSNKKNVKNVKKVKDR